MLFYGCLSDGVRFVAEDRLEVPLTVNPFVTEGNRIPSSAGRKGQQAPQLWPALLERGPRLAADHAITAINSAPARMIWVRCFMRWPKFRWPSVPPLA